MQQRKLQQFFSEEKKIEEKEEIKRIHPGGQIRVILYQYDLSVSVYNVFVATVIWTDSFDSCNLLLILRVF